MKDGEQYHSVLNRGKNPDGTEWRVVRVSLESGGFDVRLELIDPDLEVWRQDLAGCFDR